MIAVYGASGLTGSLVAGELARRKTEMVLVGRNARKLNLVAEALNTQAAHVRVVAHEDHALRTAFQDCHTVINCAGPFTRLGDLVIEASIATRCNYVDTSGEQLHIKQVFTRYGEMAGNSGVTAIPAATETGLLADLGAHLAAQHMPSDGTVTVAHQITNATPSRGTLQTLLENLDFYNSGGLAWVDGDFKLGTPARYSTFDFLGEIGVREVTKVAAPAVVTIPRHVNASRVEGIIATDLVASFAFQNPEMLPPPSEAEVNDEARRSAKFRILIEAESADGSRTLVKIAGADPYGTTAAIAVEAAMRTIQGSAYGVLAPAEAFHAVSFLESMSYLGLRLDTVTM